MKPPKNETFKVNVNKNIVGLLNLLQDKKNIRLLIEPDDNMIKNQAQVEISTNPENETVIVKANSNLWDIAYGCTHFQSE